jgi:hypothetical protein
MVWAGVSLASFIAASIACAAALICAESDVD